MDKPKDGGPAFPVVAPKDFQFVEVGMSLRDWFAGQAMPLVDSRVDRISDREVDRIFGPSRTNIHREEMIARVSYMVADAMLAEREKSQ